MKDDERFEISNLIWLLVNELKPLFLCVAWAKIIDFRKLEDLLKDIATKDWLMWKQRITLIMLISLFEEQILFNNRNVAEGWSWMHNKNYCAEGWRWM